MGAKKAGCPDGLRFLSAVNQAQSDYSSWWKNAQTDRKVDPKKGTISEIIR
jgi:hypothetical protein